jgi:hypothetical protein
MKSIRFNLSALGRSVRLFVAGCVCALMLFSNALPAYSLPNPFASDKSEKTEAPSSPTKGEDQLLGIEAGAQKVVNRTQDLLSGEEVIKKSNEGRINEVQGAADADKMKRPSNAQGETIEGILQEKLEEATGQK